MKPPEWLEQDDETLERLLVERWLYRGGLLAIMLACAIASIYFGIQGITTLADRLSVGVLLTLAVAAGAVSYVMRLADLKIHQELRRRRRGTNPSGRGAS